MALHSPDSLAPMAGFLNGLTLAKLEHLGDIYSPGVEFHDPVHHTRGLPALRQVYQQLFQQLSEVSVTVSDAHGDERTGFLLWTLRYQLRGEPRAITGTSHLQFAPDGRVAEQHDHWDASFQTQQELPLLGWAMRGIKRLVQTKPKNGT
ncbi:MAG: nuclear transport factor 2 family protein [Verrucomicrobiota bacterium]